MRFRHVFSHDADDQTPSAQALASAIDAACPVYEQVLEQATLRGRLSAAGLRCLSDETRAQDDVLVLVYDDRRPEDHEQIIVNVPPDVEKASSSDVRHLAAAVLTAGLTRLGRVLQWDPQEASTVLGAAHAAALDGLPPAEKVWAVRAEGRGVNAPEQPHELNFIGSGPSSSSTRSYEAALYELLIVLDTEEYREWWSTAPVPIGEIWCWYDAKEPSVRVRLDRRVTAAIDRPVTTIDLNQPDRQARSDLEALLKRLSQRLNLPDPPPLPDATNRG